MSKLRPKNGQLRHFVRSGLIFVLGVFIPLFAMAQARFERAKVPLKALILVQTVLHESPNLGAKGTIPLVLNTPIVVLGRSGDWFQIQATVSGKMLVGWVPRSQVRIEGAVTEVLPVQSKPIAKVKVEPLRIRLVPHAGFGYGAKRYPNQIRVGTDVLFRTWKNAAFGLNAGIGFRQILLITAGPTINLTLPWPRWDGISTELFGGFSTFYSSGNGSNNLAYGPRFGLGLLAHLVQAGGVSLSGTLRFESDIFLFGVDRVELPLLGAAGISAQF